MDERKIERGIETREDAYSNCQSEQHQNQGGFPREIERQALAEQVVDRRIPEHELHHDDCNHRRNQCEHDRLEHELRDELLSRRPQHLAHPDLFGALGRARGRQVHIVDASDEQNEQRNRAKGIDVELVSGWAIHLVDGIQMNVRQRFDMKSLRAVEAGAVFGQVLIVESVRYRLEVVDVVTLGHQ